MINEENDQSTIFVSCRWADEYQDVNDHIKGLIERAGMNVSRKMEKIGIVPLRLKESLNILDANGFCVIFIPKEGKLAPDEVLHEITIAGLFKIPTFIFVDKLETGLPQVSGALRKYQGELNCVGEWVEFRKSDLLAGRDDERILEFLKEGKKFVKREYRRIKDDLESAIAALWAQLSDMAPFHTGLMEISNAYDKKTTILYEAAARAAARITGAEFGFIGMLEHREDWMEVVIRGFYGSPEIEKEKIEKIEDALKKVKLGYNFEGETFGLTGHVCKTGIPICLGFIQRDIDKLISEGKNFVDPGHVKIQSELCVPIELKGRIIGVIDVESADENQFQKIHRIILEWLSKILSIAYSGEQLETFIGTLSGPKLNKEDLAQRILNTLMNWSLADFGFIGILENGNCNVKTILGSGLDPEIDRRFKEGNLTIKPDLGLAGKALSSGEAIYFEEPEKETGYLKWFKPVKAEIVLPIKSVNGCTIGVVDLEYILPQDFRNIDKKLFESMANLLAIAFDGGRKEIKECEEIK